MLQTPAGIPGDPTEDEQRKVRRFVYDAVAATVGRVDLRTWVHRAIYEKLEQDILKVYPKERIQFDDRIRKISMGFEEGSASAIYLPGTTSVIAFKVMDNTDINVLRAHKGQQMDRAHADHYLRGMADIDLPCTNVSLVYVPIDSNNTSDIWAETYGDTHTDDVTLTKANAFALGLAVTAITRSSGRDLQRLPGPSDLADPCDLCVARKIAAACGIEMPQTKRNFSHKAWIGTAMHQKIERDLPGIYPHAEQEITVTIATIPHLGVIKGHVDAYLPQHATMTDWKTVNMKDLPGIHARGAKAAHAGQTMLYMYGLRKKGLDCKYATLAYIPRDSHKITDTWVASCAYRQDIAVGLLNRTRSLLDRLRAGDVADFEVDPGCFPCTVQPRLRS